MAITSGEPPKNDNELRNLVGLLLYNFVEGYANTLEEVPEPRRDKYVNDARVLVQTVRETKQYELDNAVAARLAEFAGASTETVSPQHVRHAAIFIQLVCQGDAHIAAQGS